MKKLIPIFLVLFLAATLRLFALDRYPSGLNADEAALGYNAYSLIQTGRDEHGTPWPIEFRSFDDYKPGVYVYLTLPFVYFFGLNEWSVRLPSALLSILSVYLIYLLVSHLFPERILLKKNNFELTPGYLAALLLAASPWHLHFSRGGWEVNAGTTFILLGTVLFLKALKRPQLWIPSAFFFLLSLYTYHAARLVTPLLLFSFTLIFHQDILSQLKKKQFLFLSIAITLGLVLSIPLVLQFLNGSAASRFSGVGLFADTGPLSWVHEGRRLSPNPDSFLTKLRFNRYTAYLFEFIKNYLSHFSPQFLFIKGDEIARSKVPGFGQGLHLLLPFFYFGLFSLLTSFRQRSSRVVLAWLFIAPIAAALTFQSPHALRSQNMVISFSITIAFGIIKLLTWLENKSASVIPLLISLFAITLAFNFSQYLNSYYNRYPKELPFAWQYGFKDLGNYLKKNQNKYDKVIISTAYDQPYILTAFYLKYPPTLLQQQLVFSTPDKFGFSTGLSFGKYEFHPIDWASDAASPNSLIIVADETVPESIKPIHIINYPNNQTAFRLFDTNQYLARK